MIIDNVTIFINERKNSFINNGVVYFKDGIIEYAGPRDSFDFSIDDEIIDGKNGILFPALVNAHYSLYATIASYPIKLAGDESTERDYFDNLLGFSMGKIYGKLTIASVVNGIMKSLRHGCTTICGPIIHSEDLEPDELRDIAKKFRVRLSTGPVVTKENVDSIIHKWEGVSRDSYFYPVIYIAELANYSESDLEGLKKLISKGIGVDYVLFDMKKENDTCLTRWGEGLIERLLKNGLLISESGVIYGGNMTETDMDIISSRKMHVTKSLRAEMFAGTFKPNISDLLGRGMHVNLGSGFLDADIFEEAKNILLTERYHKHFGSKVIDYEIWKTMFDNNFKLDQRYFGKKTGLIKEGYCADLVLTNPMDDLEKIDPELPGTLQLILKISSETSFDKVWDEGELVLSNGIPQMISREEIEKYVEELKKNQ